MKLKELLEIYSDIEITGEQEKELKNLLEIKEKERNGKWKPKYNETYYFVMGCGDTSICSWQNQSSDKAVYDLNNCFKTKEEAEFRAELDA